MTEAASRNRAEITIAGRRIGRAHEPFVICELSGNHNGSLDRALALVDAAAATGADAIKIQTYTPDTMTIDCDRPEFRIRGGPWDGQTLYDLYGEAHTPYEWHERLFARARERGVILFSTPFDETAIDLLESLGAPAYKIASFEATDLRLIAAVARRGKPMIISTGMSNLGDITAAVETARSNGADGVALLHCTSAYPAPIADANVRTIPHLADAFGVVAGLSDHTLSSATSIAAVAVGAAIIEKHFTLARADGGPDAAFSLEPDEFAALVKDSKDAWRALGGVSYSVKSSEKANTAFRRSLYIVEAVSKGEPVPASAVRAIRPGHGLRTEHMPRVVGRRAVRDLVRGEPVAWDMLGGATDTVEEIQQA